MAITYEAIQSQTLASNQTSVTFNSFSGYTDLVVVIEATSNGDNVLARVNSDSGTNYSYTRMSGNGSTATSARAANQDYMIFDGQAYLNTTRGNWIIQFMNYANTTTYKTVISRGNNASLGVDASVNLWRSTAAITSITFTATSNAYQTGSTFTLYGIKAA